MSSKAIVLRGEPIVDEQNTGSEAITPGHLIEKNAGQWRKHATSTGAAAAVFALERDELGKGIDVAYGITDRIKAGYFKPGERVNAIVASGETFVEGAQLASDGAGRLTASNTNPVARAAAAKAAASEANPRLAVIII